MRRNPLERLEQARTEQDLIQFQTRIQNEGYSGFRPLVDGFTERVKAAADEDIPVIERLLETARRLFPDPVRFSPSWERIWNELADMTAYKKSVQQSIPEHERAGEWQIIIDNPQAIQEVVCYPGLSFNDAAYLYAYFRPRLEKSEYVRLQKIQTLIQAAGT